MIGASAAKEAIQSIPSDTAFDAAYHDIQDTLLASLTDLEAIVRKQSKEVASDYAQFKKYLEEKAMTLQGTLGWKRAASDYRRSFEEIERLYESSIIGNTTTGHDAMSAITSKQEILQIDLARLIASIYDSKQHEFCEAVNEQGTEEHLEMTQLMTIQGMDKELDTTQKISRENLDLSYTKDATERSESAIIIETDDTSTLQSDAKIEELEAHIAKLKQKAIISWEDAMPLPKPSKDSLSAWPTVELDDKQISLLADGQKFDIDIMNTAVQMLLLNYDDRNDLAEKRTHSFLPAEIIHYFLNDGIGTTSGSTVDVLKFTRLTYDIFSRQDLYFTAHINGHQHTGVIRNVSKALEKAKKTYTNQLNVYNDTNKRSRRRLEAIAESLDQDCVVIIFDSDYEKEKARSVKDHQAILTALKDYLLVEAQFNYGMAPFGSISDIDMHLITAVVPSQARYRFGLNNCGPFALRYLQLYLEDTERCCREVLPKGDRADLFWRPKDRGKFRGDIRELLCPKDNDEKPLEREYIVIGLSDSSDEEDDWDQNCGSSHSQQGSESDEPEERPVKKRRIKVKDRISSSKAKMLQP